MNGLSSSGMVAECKDRLQARSAIRRCRQTGVDVLRTLYVRTANLYVIRCWTGNQRSDAVTAWCGNASRLGIGAQSELGCSEHAAVSE